MIAAAHLDNFLFLIFFAIAILFQLLTRAASKTKRSGNTDQSRRPGTRPQTPRPASTQPQDSDEDRIRKFLEALGQPTGSEPPPPVRQRPTYQRPIVVPRVEPRQIARRILAPLPPLTTRPPEMEPEGYPTPTELPPPAPKRERRVVAPQSPATFEVHEGPQPLAAITESDTTVIPGQKIPLPISKSERNVDIVTLLQSTSGLRNAILLREIFGPPRAFSDYGLAN